MNTLLKTYCKKLSFFALLIAFSTRLLAGEHIDKILEVDENQSILVSVKSEHIVLRGWDKNQFHVKGELNDATVEYDFEKQGNVAVFIAHSKKSFFGGSSNARANTSLEIFVPAGADLRIDNVNGNNEIKKLTGPAAISSVNGDITISKIQKNVSLNTVNGSIYAKKINGSLTANTVGGDISAQKIDGDITSSSVNGQITLDTQSPKTTVNTVNGDIDLNLLSTQSLNIDSVNAKIAVTSKLEPNASVRINTVNGKIDTTFLDLDSAKVNVETMGSIDNQLSNDQVQKAKYGPNRWLNIKLGDGDSNIDLNAVSGNISLKTK